MKSRVRRAGYSLFTIAATGILGVACAAPESTPEAPVEPSVGEAREAFSSIGIERIIPIRVVQLVPPGQTENLAHDDLLRAVERANRTWRAAGIQFTIKENASYNVSYLLTPRADSENGVTRSWSQVRAELQQFYPGLASGSFTDATKKTSAQWLQAAEALAGDPTQIVEFITTEGGSMATFPWDGPAVVFQQSTIASGELVAFPHEIGHVLGLLHPNDVGGGGVDPEDPSRAIPAWKSWDTVYRPGSASRPHEFFQSRAEAQAYASSLANIYETWESSPGVWTSNCAADNASGDVSCDLGSALGNDTVTNPPGFHRQADATTFAYNIMGGPTPSSALYKVPSDSQVELVREFLRFNIPLSTSSNVALTAGMSVPVPLAGNRPYLGFAQPTDTSRPLDFDGDGRRDLAVWDPPTTPTGDGTFSIRRSGNGVTQTVTFGHHGDIPVPADYNNDGVTDIAVYRPGTSYTNNLSWWYICNGMDCSAPTAIQFGSRSNVPLPGNDMVGNAGADLMVWDRINGTYHWRSLTSTTKYSRDMGIGTRLVPIVANLSNGAHPDLAVYDMHSAILTWFDSHDGVKRQQTMSSNFIPSMSGTLLQRSAVIPLAGMKISSTWDRLGFWQPGEGRWTLLTPVIGSNGAAVSFTTTTSCIFGAQTTDQPVPGIDMSGDGASDLLIWRSIAEDTSAQLHWRSTACGAGTVHNYGTPTRARVHVVPVADMSSPPDGKPDLMVVEPDDSALWIRVLDSRTGFDTWIVNNGSLATARSIVL